MLFPSLSEGIHHPLPSGCRCGFLVPIFLSLRRKPFWSLPPGSKEQHPSTILLMVGRSAPPPGFELPLFLRPGVTPRGTSPPPHRGGGERGDIMSSRRDRSACAGKDTPMSGCRSPAHFFRGENGKKTLPFFLSQCLQSRNFPHDG